MVAEFLCSSQIVHDLDQGCCGLVEGILQRPPQSHQHSFWWRSRAPGSRDGHRYLRGLSCQVGQKKLLGGMAPGVDEICPEFLKALDVAGLSWLTRFCNVMWTLRTVALDWQAGVVVHFLKKGDWKVCYNYRRITLFSLPDKVYSGILKRRVCQIVEPHIQEQKCGFCPGRGTVDQHPPGPQGCMGVYPMSPHLFCGSVEGIRPCPSGNPVGRFCGIMGCRAPLCWLSACCMTGIRAWFALPSLLWARFQGGLDSARAALCHRFCS